MKPNGFEFAVTTIAPRPYDKNETNLDRIAEMTSYLGDPTMFVARSGFIKTKYSDPNYNPPPFIVKATPSSWGKLSIGKGSYNITVEYDQYLKLAEGDKEIQMSVVGMRATGEFVKGTNAVVLEKVVDLSTLKWDRGEGTNTKFIRGGRISFKFTPSPEYAHDNVMYYFNFNLVGENSGKQVNAATFCAGYESDAMCYKANGFHWSVYAQPQLVENGDLSTEGWKTSDGYDLSNTKSRLALVVTSPSKKQESQMNDLLKQELDLNYQEDGQKGGKDNLQEDAFESFTYNISLTICKGVSIETGQGVRIGIGFPEGFTYDDSMEGVMFEAYHFIRDAQNNVIEVEKLEVTVTPLGLIILVKSFSPFAIVVKHGEVPETTDKTVIISSTNGGTAYANLSEEELAEGKQTKNLFKVNEGQTRTVSIKAKKGYIIESIVLNDQVILTDSNEMTLDLDYSTLIDQNVMHVNFVAESVKEAEIAKGEEVIVEHSENAEIERFTKAKISVAVKQLSLEVGDEIRLEPTVTENGGTNTYQWYKDGEPLASQTNTILIIENAKASDSGEYILKITSTSGTTTFTSVSDAINVTVGGNDAGSNPSSGSVTGLIIVGIVIGLLLAVLLITIVLLIKKNKSSKRA